MILFDRFLKTASLAVKISTADDEWVYDEEPHSVRRKAILKKYPEIKRLMGSDSMIAYAVTAEVIAQLVMCYLVRDSPWTTIFVLAYCVGGVFNHSLGIAIHEIGHNLAFGHKHPVWNRLLSLLCNVPIVVPMAISYKKYHHDHHRYLGEENHDVDIPTRLEAYLFRHWSTKIVWLWLHPAFIALRPSYKSPQPFTNWEVINMVHQLLTDFFIIYIVGAKSIVYLLAGTVFGHGFHPLSAHFISEHYVFNSTGQATMSYYGPLNFMLFNVGYHVEHHDFPYIPHTKLYRVREIAPEFYDFPYHTSWLHVLWRFVFDKDHGPQARSIGYYIKSKNGNLPSDENCEKKFS